METTEAVATTSQFLADTKSKIESWIDAKEERSIRAIEFHSGVSRNYITRVLNGDIQENKIDVFKLYSILKVVTDDKTAATAIISNNNLKERFLQVMAIPEELVTKMNVSNELDHLVRDRENCLVIILAANCTGTNLKQIMSVCGDKGLVALNKLVELNYLSVQGENVSLTENYKKNCHFSREALKFMLPHLIGEYSPQRAGMKWNYISTITNSVSRELQIRIQSKMDEFTKWVHAEMQKEENQGDIPLYVGFVMDSLTSPVQKIGGLQQ